MAGAGDTVRPIMDLGGPSAAASEERLRVLIEVAPEGIFVTRDGAIIYVNRAGANLLGAADAEEVLRQPLGRYIASDDLAAGATRLASVESDRLLPRRVYAVRSKRGTTATVEATSVAIEWDGAPAALTFAHDITERVRMEAQLSRADRLTALGVLAAGVAHEVNNPLMYVALGFESLERCVHSMPEAERSEALVLLGEMRGGVERVAALMRDLQTFARDREEGPTASADLAEVLASVERLVAHQLKGRATLVLDVPAGLPPVRGATLRLEQVFVNLLLNAVQSFEWDKASAVVRVRARLDEGRVIVEVTDNGPGIPVEILTRIFDPFFTTKEPGKGSGLGLAISQAIVVGAGGEMSVETEQGRGTTFRVTLPVTEGGKKRTLESPRAVRRARILIVDDEPAIAQLLSNLLGDKHDVEVVTCGDHALARLLGGAAFDVVLCDLMMPHVTGMELHERLARARPGEESKIVFMTGGASNERVRDYLASIPNRRLEKPFTTGEFDAIVGELMAGT